MPWNIVGRTRLSRQNVNVKEIDPVARLVDLAPRRWLISRPAQDGLLGTISVSYRSKITARVLRTCWSATGPTLPTCLLILPTATARTCWHWAADGAPSPL